MKQIWQAVLVVATFALAMLPAEATAQVREGLEVYVGPSYFSSPSDREPSKPTIEAGATFWFGPRWGLGGSYGVGTSDDLLEEPVSEGTTLDFLGRGKLRFYRVMVERRFPVSPTWDLIAGMGFLGSRYVDFKRVRSSSGPPEEFEAQRGSGYVNFEMMARWRIRGRFGLRGGVDVSIPLVVRASVLASFELG